MFKIGGKAERERGGDGVWRETERWGSGGGGVGGRMGGGADIIYFWQINELESQSISSL